MGDGVILGWTGVLLPASNELSEEEIEARYGALIRSAVSAFRDDPTYIVDMAESAAGIKYKRELAIARQEAAQLTTDKVEARRIASEILADRGVYPPTRTTQKRNRAA